MKKIARRKIVTGEKSFSYVCPTWSDFPDIELYMDQVISVLERYLVPFFPEEEKCITSTMINNYVKQRLLPAPENKRYGKKHIASLFMICILKRFMQLSEINALLEHLFLEHGQEGAYGVFRACLTASMSEVFGGGAELTASEEGKTRQVVQACTNAFVAILYAKNVFAAADLVIPEVVEEKKAPKEKKEKNKEEKAKDKPKEKKAPKEKKDPKAKKEPNEKKENS